MIKPNFKIGNNWVSFYLKDIVTIRNNDWNNLEQYFNIPNPIRTIDYQKTTLKQNVIIPKEIEFNLQNENEVENKEIKKIKEITTTQFSKKNSFENSPKIAVGN